MTRKQWMLDNEPVYVSDDFEGGVMICPSSYEELPDKNKEYCCGDCDVCWNKEMKV